MVVTPRKSSDTEDFSITANEVIGRWKDDLWDDVKEIETWLNDLVIQTTEQARLKKERCEVCQSKEDALDLELHHIAGEKHDYQTITACKECHKVLTARQHVWDKRWFQRNQPQNVREAFFLQGLREILILRSAKTGDTKCIALADAYIWDISRLLGKEMTA